jgi:hypothetical protein
MKFVSAFDTFLIEEVNLNKSRIETLIKRVETIEGFITGSTWLSTIIRYSRQGSWAHKTIIKPPGTQGFDADVLAIVDHVSGWSAEDYVLKLKDVFSASGTYKDKAGLGNRCVTLEYFGDFEIDIVPCVINRPGRTSNFEVCNRRDNEFEPTDSEAYTRWLEQRNDWVGNDRFREVTRLLKYIRDVKLTFSCKSILLTTLIGDRITHTDAFYRDTNFSDLPTSLHTLVRRLDEYLQAHPDLHEIRNPVLPSENFVRHWDDDKYTNFCEMIHKYSEWIHDAFLETDEAESTRKWQRIFGDGFNKSSSKAIANLTEASLVPIPITPSNDAVQLVKTLGTSILANVKTALPWLKAVAWRIVSQGNVNIRATAYRTRKVSNSLIGRVVSGQVLPRGIEILFEAISSTGILYNSKDFEVQWQVVNTDHAAWEKKQLRGGFYPSDTRGIRWESTEYRGIHWIEAFVIRRRDRVCTARSGRFFVVIE